MGDYQRKSNINDVINNIDIRDGYMMKRWPHSDTNNTRITYGRYIWRHSGWSKTYIRNSMMSDGSLSWLGQEIRPLLRYNISIAFLEDRGAEIKWNEWLRRLKCQCHFWRCSKKTLMKSELRTHLKKLLSWLYRRTLCYINSEDTLR